MLLAANAAFVLGQDVALDLATRVVRRRLGVEADAPAA